MPTPKPSIGALPRRRGQHSSSSPPLAKMVTSCSPPASRMPRTLLRQRREIAAVEAHGADRDAGGLEPRRQRHHFSRRRFGVVGVEEEGQVLRAGRARNASNAAVSSS